MRRVIADTAGIDAAAAIVRAGGIVAIPTDTLYGLAADPFRPDAVARVFDVKGRTAERALPLIAATFLPASGGRQSVTSLAG